MLRDLDANSVWIIYQEFHFVPELPWEYGGNGDHIPLAALAADSRGDNEIFERLITGSIPASITIVRFLPLTDAISNIFYNQSLFFVFYRYISMLQWATQSPVECTVISYMSVCFALTINQIMASPTIKYFDMLIL